jgi:predicted P-loop ATPase
VTIPRTFASAAEAAAYYVALNILPVPVAYRGKNPQGDAWPKLRIDAASLPSHFNGQPQNIGALLGVSALGTAGLIDIDLDAPEALAVASALLPASEFVFGRASKPASHRLYFTDPPLRLQQFKDPLDKSMLVELRGLKKTDGAVGLQTVLPGSVHVSGELISFEPGCDSAPTVIAPDDLTFATRAVAAAALLCRYWPPRGRHDAMLALAASFARNNWTPADALTFCRALYQAVPTHDPAAVARIDSEISDSFAKVAAGEPATGFPSLTALIDKAVVETAFGWLGFTAQASADWQKQLLLSDTGTVKPLLANALTILRNDPKWRGMLAYDEFSQRAVTTRPPAWSRAQSGADWTDFDDSQLTAELQRDGLALPTRIAAEAAQTIAQESAFHPIKNYLEPLVWDRVERVNTWLTAYLGAQDSAYTRAVAACWLISGIARVYLAGCQADSLLVILGPQGSLKSTALRVLAIRDSWFSDCVADLSGSGKDARGDLSGKWLVELSELSAMRRAEVERVKAFLSCRVDHYRLPYGRRSMDIPRMNIFCGTSNDETPFVDSTGNRRFWPVRCGRIDIEALKRDRDMLWAESLVRFRAGEPWWLVTQELIDAATQAQDDRYQPGVWDEQILNWCDAPRPRSWREEDHTGELPFDSGPNRVTLQDVLTHAIGKTVEKFAYADLMQVQRCLIHNGWSRLPLSRVKGTARRVRFYERVPALPTETAARIANDRAAVILQRDQEAAQAQVGVQKQTFVYQPRTAEQWVARAGRSSGSRGRE